MPIRTDDKRRRWVDMMFVAPGDAEQVWRAMATGGGNGAWFTKAHIDERVGGALAFDMGADGTSKGEVTAWHPPRHFGYVEREWLPGAPDLATDIVIERRAGGSLVRMCHSLHADDASWDAHLEGFEASWPVFFEVLKLYLTHFSGMPGAPFRTVQRVHDTPPAVWTRLTTALGLGNVHLGEQRLVAPQPQPWTGIVERIEQNHAHRVIILRLDAPAPGIAVVGVYEGVDGGVYASVGAYFYGETAMGLAAISQHSMGAWLPQLFAESDAQSLT